MGRTFAEAERLARPLRRRALRGQGRHLAAAATTRTSPSSACWRPSPPASERILLTLATGTGKTFIAFQIAWKLFQSRWNLTDGEPRATRRPRILFLADRNILADQAYNAFSAFPEDALVRIAPDEIRKKGRVPEERQHLLHHLPDLHERPGRRDAPYFGDYPPDFFDFIVIDECHRGGANDESTWREHPGVLRAGRAARPDRHAQAHATTSTPTPTSASRSTSTRSRKASTTAS